MEYWRYRNHSKAVSNRLKYKCFPCAFQRNFFIMCGNKLFGMVSLLGKVDKYHIYKGIIYIYNKNQRLTYFAVGAS